MASTQQATKGPRSFAVFVRQLAEGDLENELSEELHKLTSDMQDQALTREATVKGELGLKLNFAVDARGVVQVQWDVKAKPPKKRRTGASVWVNKDGNVVFENPKQLALGLREVKDAEQAAKELDDEARASAGKEV